MRPKVKYAVIYRHRDEYPVSVMCRFFCVSRSGYYDFVKRLGKPESDTQLAEKIKECQNKADKTYGYRRVWKWLQKQNIHRNPKTVLRVMKKYDPISLDDSKIYGRISAELVTYGNTINTINTVLLTKKYAKFAEQISGTELYSTVFTAAVAAILSLFGVTSIPVIIFSLWQLAWCIVLRLASKRAFPRVTIDEDIS